MIKNWGLNISKKKKNDNYTRNNANAQNFGGLKI